MGEQAEVSEELLAPVGDGIEICYQTFGSPDADPLLLVMGLGGPMTWWDEKLCRRLADAGFFVIRYDNRDIGRSTRLQGHVSMSLLTRAFLGLRTRPPYTLDDMARDALGLLDHLGIGAAHVWGVSMGGMIAQTLALAHSRPSSVAAATSRGTSRRRSAPGGSSGRRATRAPRTTYAAAPPRPTSAGSPRRAPRARCSPC